MAASPPTRSYQKIASTATAAPAEGADELGAGNGIIAAFDEEIARLRANLRSWPPALDQVTMGEHLVTLMRMRVQLLQSSQVQNATPKMEMSPASATMVERNAMIHVLRELGVEDAKVNQFIDIGHELKALKKQRAENRGRVTDTLDKQIEELKTKRRNILQYLSPAIARAKVTSMVQRSKL